MTLPEPRCAGPGRAGMQRAVARVLRGLRGLRAPPVRALCAAAGTPPRGLLYERHGEPADVLQ